MVVLPQKAECIFSDLGQKAIIFICQWLNLPWGSGLLQHQRGGVTPSLPEIMLQSMQIWFFFFFFALFYLFIYFTLQYCIGFAIHWHESATGIHESQSWTPLPPPSPYHLSGSSQCTSPKHPVSCIKPRPAICFLHDSIHVSMPFSQIIPPSPSESKSPLYTSVSLAVSNTGSSLPSF